MRNFKKNKGLISSITAVSMAFFVAMNTAVIPAFGVETSDSSSSENACVVSESSSETSESSLSAISSSVEGANESNTLIVDENTLASYSSSEDTSSATASSEQSSSAESTSTEEEEVVTVQASYLAPAGYEEDTRMGCTVDEDTVVTEKSATSRNGSSTGISGIDVSHWNNSIDWSAVSAAGIQYVFVKVSGTSISSWSLYQDSCFSTNLSGAAAAGIKVGAYHFSQALNTAEAAAEANYICDLISGYSISMPVVMDYEWESSYRLADGGDYANRTAVCNQFCATVASRGYTPCVYANDSCCKNYIDAATLSASYKLWVARYSSYFPSCNATVDFWQYTSSGSVSGISGNVDMNYWYGNGMAPSAFPTSGSSSVLYMYRLYNPNSGEHFYTNSRNEASNLTVCGWNYEGVGWAAPASGSAVYRLYNPNAGDHHYTTSASERNYLASVGWNYEGVGWYSSGSYPLYRAYNPNATAGAHHFTSSWSELSYIVSKGWRYEGIAWYAVYQ